MKTLNFKLPEFGKANGTTKWVADELEKISKTFKNSTTKKTNSPCLTFQQNNKTYIFCMPSSEKNYIAYAQNKEMYNNDLTIAVYPIDGEYQWGLFTYLTPKAKEIVDDFILNVSKRWLNELEEL